ncbi:hypothetical protein M8542_27550 [Amycolatopsis sp. OK19-0408]|uniref:Uncharacterized protein n=1 Tax=Amycolatopsis iheyensis TaxID=2945988 RepID=A0A9X2NFX0_9PSEU|nr:hypothetical protein [Amycolatopsis iheyensis]MCR6486591.1 hypothetical protein [Amycolatopsis iheyensis]
MTALFEHALRLHRQAPDAPLPRDGEPYPDGERHRRHRPESRQEFRLQGASVARILDRHFADPDAPAGALVDAFHDVHVPIHPNEHIGAAARRAEPRRVRRTGRWLVRHSTDRCSVTVGLALLAADHAEPDIPLIQTIGLLSDRFGSLAAEALMRRQGGAEALLWLARRVTGWGRVYVVEALCRVGAGIARPWLLREACDGDFLNGYFAGKVATAAHLHEAVLGGDLDDDVADHTGRLLRIMTGCEGMGTTLATYPPAAAVLAAHSAYLATQAPTVERYLVAANIAGPLAEKAPSENGCTPAQRDDVVRQYLAVLNRQDWCDAVHAGFDRDGEYAAWFVPNVATRLSLRAFSSPGRG